MSILAGDCWRERCVESRMLTLQFGRAVTCQMTALAHAEVLGAHLVSNLGARSTTDPRRAVAVEGLRPIAPR